MSARGVAGCEPANSCQRHGDVTCSLHVRLTWSVTFHVRMHDGLRHHDSHTGQRDRTLPQPLTAFMRMFSPTSLPNPERAVPPEE